MISFNNMKNKVFAVFKSVPCWLKNLSPAKAGAAALILCSAFRFGSHATGSNPSYIRMGDVNGDGIVAMTDIFALIGSLGSDGGGDNFTAADMNADGRLSMADVFSLIRLVGGSDDEITEAEEVRLSAGELSLLTGESNSTAVLTAELLPENTTLKQLIWYSTNENVATVKDGVVYAVGDGTAWIVAVSADGQASARCAVTVGTGITGIEFSPTEIYVYEDSSPIMLTPTIIPENAVNSDSIWQSSDWNIVSVDNYGGITPHIAGTAVIGLTRGGVTGSCIVHVMPEPEPTEQENAPDIEEQKQQKTGVFTNYLNLSRSLDSMLDIQCRLYNVTFTTSASPAPAAEVARYVNPANFSSGAAKYQFLDLSVPNNMTAEQLNVYLKGRGILSGKGQAFIDAANECGISEAYLVAHACLETGHGTSQLARGVEYNGTTVYNMFGIGAYDGNALLGGACYAYAQGWTTPEEAIKGGARWVANNYIYRSKTRQNTLYKMRWNPLSPGYHQYATDIVWAVKQSQTIAKIIGKNDCLQIFEVPVYSGVYTGYIPDVEPKSAPDYYVSAPENKYENENAAETGEEAAQAADEAASAQAAEGEAASGTTEVFSDSVTEIPSEPTTIDQNSPEQASSEQTSSEQTSSEQTSSEQASSEQTSSEQVLSEQASSEQVSSEQGLSEQDLSEQTSSEQASSEQISSEQTSSEPERENYDEADTASLDIAGNHQEEPL